jgi:peptidoglycan hydrolase-like protein with peptidoglycan-binding domain
VTALATPPYLGDPWGASPTPAIGNGCSQADGKDMQALQAILTYNGDYSSGFSENIDGYWGGNTYDALVHFQDHHGMAPGDGCAGYNTFTAMWDQNHYTGPLFVNGTLTAYDYDFWGGWQSFTNEWDLNFIAGEGRWAFYTGDAYNDPWIACIEDGWSCES